MNLKRCANPFVRRTNARSIFTLLTVLCLPFIANGQTAWNAGTGSWFTNTNWNPTVVPIAGVDVSISNGGTAQIVGGVANAGIVRLGDLAPLTGLLTISAAGQLNSSAGVIGTATSSFGFASVDGAGSAWTTTFGITVGNFGAGNLFILNGGVVTNGSSSSVGNATGGSGLVEVNGAGSRWIVGGGSLFVGASGLGTLSILNGGRVDAINTRIGFAASGIGDVGLDGVGTMLVNSGNIHVGESSTGTGPVKGGSLRILNGAVVQGLSGVIGTNAGATGIVTVDGVGSKWTNTLQLTVGQAGSGELRILNGGEVASITGIVGHLTGSLGVVTVDGAGSKWTNTGALTVGNGGSGEVTIQNGGVVTNASSSIGKSATGIGAVTVDGTGSKWTTSSTLIVGEAGSGTLLIQNGAEVSSISGTLGAGANADGFASVDGAGSKWTTNLMIVGELGEGGLNVTDGGQVTGTSTIIGNGVGSSAFGLVDGTDSKWSNTGDVLIGVKGAGSLSIRDGGEFTSATGSIGHDTTGLGVATVDGVGSKWISTSSIFVGFNATGTPGVESGGTLFIQNGGEVSSTIGIIGLDTGGTGTATVDGAASKWTMTGDLTIGQGATGVVGVQAGGTLAILNGGAVSNANGTIADVSSSTGLVTVDGAGSKWTNTGALTVGKSGTGTLFIQNGAEVSGIIGTLGAGADADGSASVDGVGSKWTTNLMVVGEFGEGSLNVTDGGQVAVTNTALGREVGSTGFGLVNGAGSKWSNTGDVFVGFEGAGFLSITGGGEFTSATGTIGDQATGLGAVTVDGAGSKWISTSSIFVGFNATGTPGVESGGTLLIQNGGEVSSTIGIIGLDAEGTGTATVDGAGSKWTMTGDLRVGEAATGVVGVQAGGTLFIQNGGAVSNANGTIAEVASSTGLVTVDGAGSKWTTSGNLTVGRFGSGTLNLLNSGAATVGGGTGVLLLADGSNSTGVLNIGDGGAPGVLLAAEVVGGQGEATVNFNHNSAGYVFTPQITGSTAVNVLAGTTIFDSTHAYTGLTSIHGGLLYLTPTGNIPASAVVFGGQLRLDGTVGGNVEVQAAGLLTGNGFIGGSLVNAGVVAPGNSPGTLHVAGNYTQTSSGTLVIEIAGFNPGQYDVLAVGGHASLSGRLVLTQTGTIVFERGQRARFLTAGGGISGRFSQITNGLVTGTILEAEVRYESNAVVVEIVQGSFAEFGEEVGEGLPEELRQLLLHTGLLLDDVVFDEREQLLIAFLNSIPLEDLPELYFKIAPEELSVIHELGVAMADAHANFFDRRAAEIRRGLRQEAPPLENVLSGKAYKNVKAVAPEVAPPSRTGWSVFSYGDATWLDLESSGFVPGYDTLTGGFSTGADYQVNANLTVGVIFSYAGSDANLNDDGELEMESYSASLYAAMQHGSFYLNGLVGGAFNEIGYARAGLLGKADGDTNGGAFNALLSGGYEVARGNWRFGPTWGVHYTYVGYDELKERGSFAPLEIQSNDTESLRSALGFEVSCAHKVGRALIVPRFTAAWQHEFGDRSQATDFQLASGAGDIYRVEGPEVGRDALLLGASVSILWSPRFSTYVGYHTQLLRENYEAHSLSAGATWTF